MGPLITYREVVPWKVATRYADTAVMHHLRTMAQLQKGMEVPAVAKRRLHEWLQYLENNRLVLDYSPDCPPTRRAPWAVSGTAPAGPKTDPSTVTPQTLATRGHQAQTNRHSPMCLCIYFPDRDGRGAHRTDPIDQCER